MWSDDETPDSTTHGIYAIHRSLQPDGIRWFFGPSDLDYVEPDAYFDSKFQAWTEAERLEIRLLRAARSEVHASL